MLDALAVRLEDFEFVFVVAAEVIVERFAADCTRNGLVSVLTFEQYNHAHWIIVYMGIAVGQPSESTSRYNTASAYCPETESTPVRRRRVGKLLFIHGRPRRFSPAPMRDAIEEAHYYERIENRFPLLFFKSRKDGNERDASEKGND